MNVRRDFKVLKKARYNLTNKKIEFVTKENKFIWLHEYRHKKQHEFLKDSMLLFGIYKKVIDLLVFPYLIYFLLYQYVLHDPQMTVLVFIVFLWLAYIPSVIIEMDAHAYALTFRGDIQSL